MYPANRSQNCWKFFPNRDMLQILGFRALGRANLPANIGSTLPLVPTFCAGCFRNRQFQPSRVFLSFCRILMLRGFGGCSSTRTTITHKKITKLIPKRFRFGTSSTQNTEYNSQNNSVRDSAILCSHFGRTETNYPDTPTHPPTLAFLKKARETLKKERVLLFAEPLKSLEKKGKCTKKQGKSGNEKSKEIKKGKDW